MVRKAWILGAALALPAWAAPELPTIRIGWIPNRAVSSPENAYRSIERHLEERVPGYLFRFVPVTYADSDEKLRRGEIEFFFCGPTLFVELEVRGLALPVATVISGRLPEKPTELLGSAVIAAAGDQRIRTWRDLRRKRIAALAGRSLGGWLAAARELQEEGIDPHHDVAGVQTYETVEEIVAAVRERRADAGILPTGMLEWLVRRGEVEWRQLKVLKPRSAYPGSADFPYVCSTRLYPNSVMARSPRVPNALADQVAVALLSMPADRQAASITHVAGWTTPLSYESVRQCMIELGVPPFERNWRSIAAGLFREHQVGAIVAICFAGSLLALSAGIALVSNVRLRRSRVQLSQELAERKAAEAQLHYQATLLAQTSDAVVATDIEYVVTYWNPAAERLLGVPKAKAVGCEVGALINYQHPPEARRMIRESLRVRGFWAGEAVIRRPDGAILQVELAVNEVRGPGGELVGSVGTFRDITDRKRADEMRRLETARLDAMFRLAQMSSASRKELANYALSEAVRLTGSEFGYLAGLSSGASQAELRAWAARDPNSAVSIRWEDISAAGLCYEAVEQRRPMIIAPVPPERLPGVKSLLCAPIFDGDQIVLVASLANKPEPYNDNDIRQLSLLMDGAWKLIRLRESQNRYEVLFEDSPVPIVEADFSSLYQFLQQQPGGMQRAVEQISSRDSFLKLCLAKIRIQGLNAEARKLLRVETPEQLRQQFESTLPDAARRIIRPGLAALAAGASAWAGQVELAVPGGGRRWLDVRLSPVPSSDQPWSRVILSLVDFTERKRLEEQLLQSQKMEAVGNLAGGIAHDFNNLLTVINGYTELAAIKLEEGHPSLAHLDEVRKAGERATELTRQLLAFSRKQVLQPRPLDLNQAVLDAERMLRRVLGERVEVVTDLAPDLGAVSADPTQIHQVILNLAVNARDAMPDGGKLFFQTANVELGAGSSRFTGNLPPGKYVMLAVSDTGIGMDESTLARVFEPFFTTKEPGRGTGLGLSTVYGIVSQSGGGIEVLSQLGAGATFKIVLPRIVEEADAAHPEAESAPGGTETILLVEDEADVRHFAAEALRSYGYSVLEAAGGREALRIAEAAGDGIRLLVTDVVMPEMNGTELASRITSVLPDVRVVYMSGYPDGLIGHIAPLRGDALYLQKPFSSAALARKVREALAPGPSAV